MDEVQTQESGGNDTTSYLNPPQPSNFSTSNHRSGKNTVRFTSPAVYLAGPSTARETNEQHRSGALRKNGRSVMGDVTQPSSIKKLVIHGFKRKLMSLHKMRNYSNGCDCIIIFAPWNKL